jgi:sugar O-acyltransferase (sialic acid O-acetyltransferase NeuD family)
MKDLVIFGASDFGKEVAFLVEDINEAGPQWNLLGFIDDDPRKRASSCLGYPVLGGAEWVTERSEPIDAVVAIGDPRIRRIVVDKLAPHVHFATLVHPSARCHRTTVVGEGTILCAGTIVTVEIELGRHVIVNLDCTIGHGARIGEFCVLNPGVHVSGDVTLAPDVSVGTGSQIIDTVSVGSNSVIGAGAVVIRDLPPNVVAVGSPAKAVKERDPKQSIYKKNPEISRDD